MGEIADVRWLRALLAGFLAELALVVIAVLVSLLPGAATALNWVVPPASLVAFLVFGYWAARPLKDRFVLHGLLSAVLGIALYFALTFGALSLPGAPAADFAAIFAPAYVLAHALKLVGGALGGLLAARAAGKPSAI